MTDRVQDALAALSLANLSLIGLWDGLLNYTPDQAFFLEHAPPKTEYAAAFLNVFLIGVVFFLLFRLARWIGTRYGFAGVVFGTIPILLLTALPAAKSFLRLMVNRNQEINPTILISVLALVVVVVAAIARRRFFVFATAVLVTISPLILIEAVLSVARCRTAPYAEYADTPLAPRAPPSSLPRVVWIVFDELDFRLAFPDRPPDVLMPEFDRLRGESLFAEKAFSPASYTLLSVPSLLTGKSLISVETLAPRMAILDDTSASAQPTVFSSIHAMGGNAAVVGWYLPYCRIFSQDLAACSAHDMQNELSETGFTFAESLVYQQRSLFAYGYRSLFGQSPRAEYRIKALNDLHRDALRDVVDPTLNLVFLHFPVPHAPHLYDRISHTYPKRSISTGTYLDSLVLADVFLHDIRESMTAAGLWDKTTLIVTSDHPDRLSAVVDGKEDPRVPFLLKLAGQTSRASYSHALPTVLTKPLVEAILKSQVTTPEDAAKWLRANTF